MVSILVVEDDEMVRKLIRHSLEVHYKVIEATNGEEALENFNSKIIDLVILDINIGKGMNGFEVCRNIRKNLYGGLIPIIFMTTEKSEQSITRGYQEGADAFLHKPCSMPELLARVKALLQRDSLDLALQALCNQNFRKGSIIEGKQDSYKIKNLMEKGGMGAVFLAQKLSDKSLVAIKTIMPGQLQDQNDLKRLLREAEITIKIKHRNIANGIEVIRSDSYFAFVMEYIEGYTLEEAIKIKRNLTAYEAVSVIEQIAKALHHLDQQNIIHRDVHPKNIIIAKDGRAILIDLGISKAKHGSSITAKDVIVGTMAYIAPELLMVDKVKIASDIYSLGLTFFYALTGQAAYKGENIHLTIAKKLSQEEAPKFQGYNIPKPVLSVMEKMTFMDPRNRYQNPMELIKDLQKIRKEIIENGHF